jgi:potassium-transporting ATPase potassium-binding subunit
MHALGWIQLGLFLILLFLITKPLGIYLYKVLTPNERTFLHPLFGPIERLIYRLAGIQSEKEQGWLAYTASLLIFSLITCLLTYAVLRLQYFLPLNPQNFAGLSPHLAFNTAISFTTNTNWQSYSGESTLSYFSQMVALTSHNFFSAAVGIAVAAAVVRSIARATSKTLGNFWVDLVRINLYLLLPISIVFAVFLVSQGMIQNFLPYTTVTGPDGFSQTIAQGPMASQVAIKMLGTNGGGFMNANAAHPFENPTPLSNFLQMLSIFSIGSALTYYMGKMVKNQKHGWSVWAAMTTLFVVGALVCWWAETHPSHLLQSMGINITDGNMEGKEVRFGIFNSSLFATITTDASCGAVNAMHDSFTPLGGLVPLFNIQLGELIFGGVGSGLYAIIIYIVLSVFIAGLMVGRTPEYLGKKIEGYDVKVAVLYSLVGAIFILGFTAFGAVSKTALAGLNNAGPHGFTEILYAFSSATGNNGSAFAGLTANAPWWNTALGIAMFVGRFWMILPVMALAGNLVTKKIAPASAGSFPVTGFTFTLILMATIVIVGGLTFLPALAIGPVVEHFIMIGSGKLF